MNDTLTFIICIVLVSIPILFLAYKKIPKLLEEKKEKKKKGPAQPKKKKKKPVVKKKQVSQKTDIKTQRHLLRSIHSGSKKNIIDLDFNRKYVAFVCDEDSKFLIFKTEDLVKKGKFKVRPFIKKEYTTDIVDYYPTCLSLHDEIIAVAIDSPNRQEIRVYLIEEGVTENKLSQSSVMHSKDNLKNEIQTVKYLYEHQMVICICKEISKLFIFCANRSELLKIVDTGQINIKQMKVSPNEKYVAMCSFFMTPKVYAFKYKKNRRTDKLEFERSKSFIQKHSSFYQHSSSIECIAFNHTGQRMVSISDKQLILSYVKKPKPPKKPVIHVVNYREVFGINGTITQVDFTRNFVAFASGKTVFVLKYVEDHKNSTGVFEIKSKIRSRGTIKTLKMSTNGKTIAIGYSFGEVDILFADKRETTPKKEIKKDK